jgi:hypothetical protein
MADRPIIASLAKDVARFGLPSFRPEPEPTGLTDQDWGVLLGYLSVQRLTGLGVAAMKAGWLRPSDTQRFLLLDRHRRAMTWALTLERRLLQLAEAFRSDGIDFVVLKGAALAHTHYPDPSWRAFGDLDLLVHTKDWQRSCQLLRESGFRRLVPEPRPRFDERFGKAATHADVVGLQVDLHRTLVIGPFGFWIDSEQLFQRRASFQLAGQPLPRLDDTALFLHACVHGVLGAKPPLLLPLRDIAQIATMASVNYEELAEWVHRWRMRSVMQLALQTASETLQVRLPESIEAFHRQKLPRVERRALRAYTSDGRQRAGMAVATVSAISGFRAKLAYVLGLLFPSREFLAARAASGKPSYVRRLMLPVRWLLGRGSAS